MTTPPGGPGRLLRAGVPVLAAVALWLVVIDWPDPVTDYLDASWQAALVDAHQKGRSFGNGIIFSAGPLGFLNSHFYLPGSLEVKLWWETAGKLVLAALFVLLAAPLQPVRRTLFLAAAILLITYFPDTFFTVLLTLSVLEWLLPPAVRPWRMASAIVLTAFLSQLKFTHCILAFSGIALALGSRCIRRDWRGAWVLGTGFVAAFLGFWLLAGQNPVRLWDYFRYSWQISSGYPWAMSFDETLPVFAVGTGVALLCAASIWRTWRAGPGSRLAAAPVPLFLAAAGFLTWKHGFTRADGHVLAFFLFSLLIGLALPALVVSTARRWWFEALAPCCVLGIWLAEPGVPLQAPKQAIERLSSSIARLSNPHEFRSHFADSLARERAANDLPALRQAIGNAPVDLLNFEQGLLLLNDLNYHPRPIPQSYSVYTEPLLHKNAGFFRGSRAPEFVVVRLNSIDGRFPMQDDSMVLGELPLRHDLVLEDGANALFRRKSASPHPMGLSLSTLAEHDTALGQEIAMPAPGDHPVWLQAWFQPTWLGRLRSLLYKPPQLMMVTTDSRGEESRHRIIPPIATTGFVIQPLIQNTSDYAEFARGRGTKLLRSIRFEAATSSEEEFWTRSIVRFSEITDLPMVAVDPMQLVVEAGISNLPPVEVTSDTTVQYVTLPDRRSALLVHATGSMAFEPDSSMRHIHLEFGISEGAYTGTGRTDGAEFLAECTFADGRTDVIWSRLLNPLQEPGDRGMQHVIVKIPEGATRVTLRTLPGPARNGNWDWTYWARVTFLP